MKDCFSLVLQEGLGMGNFTLGRKDFFDVYGEGI